MTTPAKKPRRAALNAKPPSTAMQAADTAIAQAAAAPAPMQSRVITARNEIQAKANDLLREREAYTERQTLLQAQYEAASLGLQENIADINAALDLLNGGLSVSPSTAGAN